jgi:zinc and cadmium transporter
MSVWTYAILSVFLISLVSLVGAVTIAINKKKLKTILIYFISFSAGALIGDAFFHIIPEVSENGLSFMTSSIIIAGIICSFLIEKIIKWRHCHLPITKNHIHSFAYMNIIGDSVHNLIDGLIIGASFLSANNGLCFINCNIIPRNTPRDRGFWSINPWRI